MNVPKTIAIIMDGNGRWAKAKGLPRTAGHKQGADTLRTVALHANRIGIEKLILYAFSTENWKRPEDEVSFLCKLPGLFFNRYIKELMENNIQNWLPDGKSGDKTVVQVVMSDKLAGWIELNAIARAGGVDLETKYINGNRVTLEIPASSRGAFTIAIREAGWRYADQNGVLHIIK